MKSNSKFEVVSLGLSIILFLISTGVFSSEVGASDPKDSSRAPRKTREAAESLCETNYSEITDRNPILEVQEFSQRGQDVQCHSTQPINWIFNRSPQESGDYERGQEITHPFHISTKVVPCGSWEIPIVGNFSMAAPVANSNSKIGYFFTSTLKISKRDRSKSPEYLAINIFCGTFTPTTKSKSAIFPRAQIELHRDGKFDFINQKETSVPETSRKCDDLILADDNSTGQCACESTDGPYFSPFFTICSDLMRCRVWAESRPKSFCEAKTVDNRCNISSFILPQDNKGGILYCHSTKRSGSPFTTFFPIPDSSLSKAGKSESNLTEIQILGDSTEIYKQFLKLSLVSPENESDITRKTGVEIVCRGPAFLFLQRFLWTVESKDNETDFNSLPTFTISETGTEALDGQKYSSSTLRILGDDRKTNVVVNVTCQAFVNDRPFFVQSNLPFKLVYKPKLDASITCDSRNDLQFACYLGKDVDDPFFTVTWNNDSGHELDRDYRDSEGTKYWYTCSQNITCTATWSNGVSNFYTFNKEDCEKTVKQNSCTGTLQKEKPTTATEEPTTTQITTTTEEPTISTTMTTTIATTTSGTVSTDSTVAATTATTTFATTTESATTPTDSFVKTISLDSPAAAETATKKDTPNSLTVGLIVVAVVLLLVVVFVVFKYFQTKKELRLLTANEIDEFVKGDPGKLKDVEIQGENVHLLPFNKKYEVSDSDYSIDHGKILGSGEFGTVYGGTLRQIPVAIKTTKSETDVEVFKAFLKEIKVMTFIGEHENVVQLLGTVTNRIRERVVFIIVELATHGSLHSFLREHQNDFVNSLSSSQLLQISPDQINSTEYLNTSPSGQLSVTTHDLVKWCGQIASGMAHLASKKIIHGDLAARNILLFDDYTAKITDFGLARQLYTSPNYVKKQQSPLPWRIMAPESLKNLQFSTKSDVWAFGVLAWEIFSLAAVPYAGLSWTHDFVDQLKQDLRLQKPKWATNDIYENMCSCWHTVANCRPDFEHLEQFYKEMLQNPANESETVYLELVSTTTV